MKELSKEEKKYFEDLKNLKPLPLDPIPSRPGDRFQIREDPPDPLNPRSIGLKNNINIKPEVIRMEPLNNSKTLWGFGIAVFIYIVQNILIMLNVAGPDNLIMKSIIEAVIAIAGFFGVYGIRDALRKMSL